MTRFWHHRISEAAMLFCGILLAVFLAKLIATDLLQLPDVSIPVAAIVVLTLALALAAYFKATLHSLYSSALAVYSLLTVALTLFTIDNIDNLQYALPLLITTLFAAYFRSGGLFVAVFAAGAAGAWIWLTGDDVTSLIPVGVLYVIVLLLGYVLFYKDNSISDESTTEDVSYRQLVTKYSQVSGKSDIVISAITDGVIAINNKGIIELINPAAEHIIGWDKQDALSLDYRSVIKLVDNKNESVLEAVNPIAKVLVTNTQEITDKLSMITNAGKKILTSLMVSPVGQPGSGVIIVFRDITDEKTEERQQAEFISTASHEMRTPVAAIEGYLGLALNPATAQVDDKARDFITKAHAAAQHLGRLFQDLLDVTKAEDGRLASNPRVVDVVPFVQDIFEGLEQQATSKGLRFIYKPSLGEETGATERGTKTLARTIAPVFYVNVDNDHLREIVGNLIENAIKYTPSGEVVVDVTGDNDHITVSITDTGLGIPKEDQAHLFQKFYRVDNSETREIGGTGLGLYLCRRLAETMDGRIWVESDYKKGSTFNLEIPRIDHLQATKLIEDATSRAVDTMDSGEAATPPSGDFSPHNTPPQQPVIDTAQRPNTPLSAIEANPAQYLEPRDGSIRVPPPRSN